ncbi:hypothetical protein JCM10908_004000 [Rhodotorula pacifica]|uniref:uncharacterized protein n=1 Tax=Rhodotorula pacifica TaxID=1495444 RepID=UPI00317FCFE4
MTQVSCDLVRPTCGACEKYMRTRPEHRCVYAASAVLSEPRTRQPNALDFDDFLPRTRSGLRFLREAQEASPPTPQRDEKPEETLQDPEPEPVAEPTEDLTIRMAATTLAPTEEERRFELPPALDAVGFQPINFPTFPKDPFPVDPGSDLTDDSHSLYGNAPSNLAVPPSNLIYRSSHAAAAAPANDLSPVAGDSQRPDPMYAFPIGHQSFHDNALVEDGDEAGPLPFDPPAMSNTWIQPCVSPQEISSSPSFATDYRLPQPFIPPLQQSAAYSAPYPVAVQPPFAQVNHDDGGGTGPAPPHAQYRLPAPFIPPGHRQHGSLPGPLPVDIPPESTQGGYDFAEERFRAGGGHSWP